MYDAGTASLKVVPDFGNLSALVKKQMAGLGVTGAKAYGDSFRDTLRSQFTDLPVGPSKSSTTRQGAQSGGSFADGFRARVKAALRDLPPIEIGAATTAAEQKIRDLRSELKTLADKRVGVDVDTTAALAQVRRIGDELDELGRNSPSVQVRADAGAASAELAAIRLQVESLSRQDVNIDVDVQTGAAVAGLVAVNGAALASSAGIGALGTAGALLGVTLVPGIAAAAAGLVALGSIAGSVFAGIGVGVLAFGGIGDAVKAMGAAQTEAGTSAATLASRQAAVASAADQVASSERALAATRVSNAAAEARAAQQVVDATRNIVRAQEDRKQATLDLVRAQEEQRRAEQDLAFDLEGVGIAQRRAAADQAEAKAKLDKVLADPKATLAQKEAAKLTYDEIDLRVRELAVQQKRLAAEQEHAAKVGINGSDRVKAAQDRVKASTEGVTDAQRALGVAVAAQTAQQRQSADALANAQQQVTAAQRAMAVATVASAGTASAATNKLKQAMEALSPAGRTFAEFIFGLKDEMKGLRAAAAEGFLPGVQSGIEALLPRLPQVETLISRIATVLGNAADRAGKALGGPAFDKFFDFMETTGIPLLEDFLEGVGNVAGGFFNLMQAFSPFTKDFSGGLLGMTEKFEKWSQGLETNKGFQSFLAYIRENGPKFVDFLKEAGIFIGRLIVGLAPLGAVVTAALGGLFKFLNTLDPTIILGFIGAIAGVVAYFAGGFLVTVGLVVAAVVGIVGAVVYAYTHFETFRNIVDTVVRAIATAAIWLWENALKPAFVAIVGFVRDTLAPAMVWLWNNVISPVFNGIATVIGFVWNNIVKPIFTAIGWTITNILAPLFLFLYNNVIKPVWAGIKLAISIAWAAIQIIFNVFRIEMKILGSVFSWLYNNIVKPIWGGISSVIGAVWDKVRPIFDAMAGWVRDKLPAAFKGFLAVVTSVWNGIRDAAKIPIKFVVETIINKGIIGNFNKLAGVFGIKPIEPIEPLGFHAGGPVYGRGRKGVDSVNARLAPGEHVFTAAEVDALGGHRAVYQLRAAALSGGLPGFANGGAVGDGFGDLLSKARKKASDVFSGVKDLFTDPAGSLKRLVERLIGLMPGGRDSGIAQLAAGLPTKVVGFIGDKLKSLVGKSSAEGSGVAPGGLGWERMMTILHGPFPGLPLNSGLRPGAITATGNASYHGVGRAVDIPPRMDVFNWIASNFPDSRELIYSPANNRQIWNGHPHLYSGITRQMHYDHVHWAYDQGGMLPTGASQVWNGTGRPERVLTEPQWQSLSKAAALGQGGATTNEYHLHETRATIAELQRLQDRQALLARIGRAG